jgi:FkbM family methyltransferase
MLVTSWHDYPGALTGRTEAHLIDWFGSVVGVGTTWLDVGAHYGYTALALSRLVGPEGRVVAFEPMVATAGHLSATRHLNNLTNLTVVPLGLDSYQGLKLVDARVERGMANPVTSRPETSEYIFVTAYDALESTLQVSHVDGVKIDVQGMELEVLKGMHQMLKRDHPLLAIEFHAGVDRENILALLRAIGYEQEGRTIETAAAPPPYQDDASYSFQARA